MAKISQKSGNWGKGEVLLLSPQQWQWRRSTASQNPEVCEEQPAGLHF